MGKGTGAAASSPTKQRRDEEEEEINDSNNDDTPATTRSKNAGRSPRHSLDSTRSHGSSATGVSQSSSSGASEDPRSSVQEDDDDDSKNQTTRKSSRVPKTKKVDETLGEKKNGNDNDSVDLDGAFLFSKGLHSLLTDMTKHKPSLMSWTSPDIVDFHARNAPTLGKLATDKSVKDEETINQLAEELRSDGGGAIGFHLPPITCKAADAYIRKHFTTRKFWNTREYCGCRSDRPLSNTSFSHTNMTILHHLQQSRWRRFVVT